MSEELRKMKLGRQVERGFYSKSVEGFIRGVAVLWRVDCKGATEAAGR